MSRLAAAVVAFALFLPALTAAQQPVGPVPGPEPQKLIQDTAQRMLYALNVDRAAYRKDMQRVYKLVDEVLVPHFDLDYSSRLVLGKHWRTATPDQRKRFQDAFYHSLLRTYGNSLVDFTADRLKVLPFKGDLATGQATVRTEVRRDDGTRVPVNYSLRATPQGWKAWDVTIEGISYVKNFKSDFGTQIEQEGIEAVIKRLETENIKPSTPAKSGGSPGR
jgi:phospholipid transport system substrate-binding protein